MARFTNENKWEDKWFRRLTVGQKLIFLYLCDKCNLAGFMEWDSEFASFQIGVEESKIEGALKGLERGMVRKGDYIWVKNFLKHQKNSALNPNNPAHKNIIRCMHERKEFHKEIEEIYGPLKGLFSSLGIGKGIGKGNKGGVGGNIFTPPKIEEVEEYCKERENNIKPQQWYDHYTSNGWIVGKTKMKDWKAAIRTWEQNGIRVNDNSETPQDDSHIQKRADKYNG